MPRIRTHPGEVLREEFLVPLGLSARKLAEEVGVPPNRLSDIAREHRGITADTAIRLGRRLGTTPHFWMNLQAAYDLSKAEVEHDYSQYPGGRARLMPPNPQICRFRLAHGAAGADKAEGRP